MTPVLTPSNGTEYKQEMYIPVDSKFTTISKISTGKFTPLIRFTIITSEGVELNDDVLDEAITSSDEERRQNRVSVYNSVDEAIAALS